MQSGLPIPLGEGSGVRFHPAPTGTFGERESMPGFLNAKVRIAIMKYGIHYALL